MGSPVKYHAVPTVARSTRDCTDPWIFAQLTARRELRPCCWHPPVGTLAPGESLETVLNGPAMRKLREELLTGHLNEHCLACPARPLTSIEALRVRVEAELAQTGIAVRAPDECPEHLHFGGHVDSIVVRPELVTVHGWGMLNVVGSHVFVGTNLPVKCASVFRVWRRDVAKSMGDQRLSKSGFEITLELTGPPSKSWALKIWTEDQEMGSYRVQTPAHSSSGAPQRTASLIGSDKAGKVVTEMIPLVKVLRAIAGGIWHVLRSAVRLYRLARN
jgi:hypothetical protein